MNTIRNVFYILGILLVTLVTWEFVSETKYNHLSLVLLLQENNYLLDVPITVEPNKGIWHNVGWLGSGLMLILPVYSLRKRFRIFHNVGLLNNWLKVHIFIGIISPILISYHATFKLGGIIAVSYWSMILVAASGIMGRYLYLKIPKGISGNELEIDEIKKIMSDLSYKIDSFKTSEIEKSKSNDKGEHELLINITKPDIPDNYNIFMGLYYMVKTDIENLKYIYFFRQKLKHTTSFNHKEKVELFSMVKRKAELIREINFLKTTHKLFHYWHVFHIPMTIIMFTIMFMHIGIYFIFRA